MDIEKQLELENKRVQILMDALHSVLIKDGVLSEDSNPTGPELLMAAEEYCQ